MTSISTSKKLIASVKNLTIAFPLDYHMTITARDLFVKFMKSPIKTILEPKKMHVALSDINFDLYSGERLGIIGINGSGKTTLCRTLSQMYFAQSGSVKVNGLTRAIFDTSVGIIPELTGRENAHLIAQLMFPECSDGERKNFVEDALDFSELGHFVDIPFKNYSKGMQSRLCLSLISSKESDLLILDEVFDGADEFFQAKISKRVLSMIEKSGAVIFISHSPEQFRQACNRLIVLHHGQKLFDGEVEEGIEFYHQLNSELS